MTRPHPKVGVVFQTDLLLYWRTVTENILTGARGLIRKSVWDEIYAVFPVLHEMRKRQGGGYLLADLCDAPRVLLGQALVRPMPSRSQSRRRRFASMPRCHLPPESREL